jgi:hypothetical protein
MSQARSKRPAKAKQQVVALALTWDGARWPVKSLPANARAFLAGKATGVSKPKVKELSQLFADDRIREIRICWVPRLKGGADVLSEAFAASGGKRVAFQLFRKVALQDMLGVIYRRA